MGDCQCLALARARHLISQSWELGSHLRCDPIFSPVTPSGLPRGPSGNIAEISNCIGATRVGKISDANDTLEPERFCSR